ncbi:MAG: DUF11 domain-containing protein [Planctomycetes bacterium]|nr:DUF11 domain-containing protein [Planctomycetota bacterium]
MKAIHSLRQAVHCTAALLAALLCSCTTLAPMLTRVAVDPSAASAEPSPATKSLVTPIGAADTNPVGAQSPLNEEGTATAASVAPVQPASAAREATTPGSACPPEFTPADPRQMLPPSAWGAACVPPAAVEYLPPPARPEDYLDEYLCDGGDRGLPVHYGPHARHGLETEDTVGEYLDETGKLRVTPSTRICVYAPRFAAVRTLSGPNEDIAVEEVGRAETMITDGHLRNRLATTWHAQPEQPIGLGVRSRPSGLETDNRSLGVDLPIAVADHVKLLGAFEELTFFRTGELIETEEARLLRGIQAAAVWTRTEFPMLAARSVGGQEILVTFKPQELVGLKLKEGRGRLRIIKTADRTAAEPGDVITFTLRYDNFGDGQLLRVRIVDNLTPRLDYIVDSATSDRPGDIIVEDNGEGSVVLSFVLDAPLPAETGGTISFQARVR